jgi:hypothetical protein
MKKTLINLSRDSTKKEQGTKDTHFTLTEESQCNTVFTHYLIDTYSQIY